MIKAEYEYVDNSEEISNKIKELFILSEFSSCVFSDNTTIENTKKNMKCVIRQKASEILCGKRTKL